MEFQHKFYKYLMINGGRCGINFDYLAKRASHLPNVTYTREDMAPLILSSPVLADSTGSRFHPAICYTTNFVKS